MNLDLYLVQKVIDSLFKNDTTISSLNSFYVKFSKTNTYLSVGNDNNYLTNTNKSIDKWIFEKPKNLSPIIF